MNHELGQSASEPVGTEERAIDPKSEANMPVDLPGKFFGLTRPDPTTPVEKIQSRVIPYGGTEGSIHDLPTWVEIPIDFDTLP